MATPQAVPLDEGVQNLNQFAALLAAVNQRLDETTPALENTAEALERSRDELQQEVDRFDGALDDTGERMESGWAEASAALEDLRDLAERSAELRLDDVREAVDTSAETLHSAGDTGRQQVEGALAELSAGGVTVFDEALATIDVAASADLAEAEKELHELASGLADLGERAVGAAAETTAQLDETAGSAASEQERLVSGFRASTDAWDEAIDGGLLAGAKDGGAAVQDAHESWQGTATATAAAFFDSMADAAAAAEDAVAETADTIDAACASLLADSGEALCDEIASAGALVGAAEPLTSTLDGLLPDLAVTLRIVAQVDLLLQEMA